ncbi:MAG: YCF48-related protein, partial [Armatimonadota bacterium]|nr:YCF48-related protein [Armatimonadota bacterium]
MKAIVSKSILAHISVVILNMIFVLPALGASSGWIWQNPLPQGNNLADVHFVNSSNGWAVGDVGTILKTTNGGATWTPQVSKTVENLVDITFVDYVKGWICSENGK